MGNWPDCITWLKTPMSLTQELIGLIRNKPIQPNDLDQAALLVIDAVGCAYAGTATPVGKILREWAGAQGYDDKRAALLMGALTHITETDDLHRASVTHPGCVVIPAVLALGERLGSSAEQTLIAIMHGFEAMCRIGAGVGPAHYKVWHNTATCGPFGSAMACASLLGLDEEQTLNALGNAGTQASGFWQFMATGAMSKHLHAGRACESGWLAAELAQHNFTGSPEILEGAKGFFVAMCDDPKPEQVMAEADAPWQIHATSIKPWPSCRHTHPIIDCALELHDMIGGQQASSINVKTYQAALDVCNYPQPESEYQAKFSLFHTAAIATLDGEVGLNSFDETARARTTELRGRTQIEIVDPYLSNYPVSWGAEVMLTTDSGETFKVSRQDCKGDPELALDRDEMRHKAMGLMQFGGLNADQARSVCDSILSLPSAPPTPAIFHNFIGSLKI